MKIRLDKLLVERGLARSRERAQALILAGRVLVGEQKLDKAGASVTEDAAIRLTGQDLPFVSRGGLKLQHAVAHWNIALKGRVCLDVGASTGGFTDCMLQNGAARVVGVDTGYGQIDLSLRTDPRVRLLERTNARYLAAADIPEVVTFVAMDVAFISATLVLPAVLRASLLSEGQEQSTKRELIVLVKPQFEAGRELVGKGGIVRDEGAQRGAVEKVSHCVEIFKPITMESTDSPILGGEGNREFLLFARWA